MMTYSRDELPELDRPVLGRIDGYCSIGIYMRIEQGDGEWLWATLKNTGDIFSPASYEADDEYLVFAWKYVDKFEVK